MDKVEIGGLYVSKTSCLTEYLLVTGWDDLGQVFLVYEPLFKGEFNHWSIGAGPLLAHYEQAARAQQ